MNNLKHIPLYALILFFTGCAKYVGGKCTYEQTIGIAKISSKEDRCQVDFYPAQEPWREWNIKKPVKGIDIKCSDFQPNHKYPALYKKISSGTCTPFKLTLYKADELSLSINNSKICLDENDLKTDGYTQNQLKNISTKYTLLKQVQKDAKLGYSIILQPKYSNDYAFSLSLTESKKFKKLMLNSYNINTIKQLNISKIISTCRDNEIEIVFRIAP